MWRFPRLCSRPAISPCGSKGSPRSPSRFPWRASRSGSPAPDRVGAFLFRGRILAITEVKAMTSPREAVLRRGFPRSALALAAWVGVAANGADETPLAVGVPIVRQLAGGERQAFTFEPAAGPLLLTVEQRGINVALAVIAPGSQGAAGEELGVSNQDGQREGWETLLLPARAAE